MSADLERLPDEPMDGSTFEVESPDSVLRPGDPGTYDASVAGSGSGAAPRKPGDVVFNCHMAKRQPMAKLLSIFVIFVFVFFFVIFF